MMKAPIKILMNYIAPQIALFYVKQKVQFVFVNGLGYQLYKDKVRCMINRGMCR